MKRETCQPGAHTEWRKKGLINFNEFECINLDSYASEVRAQLLNSVFIQCLNQPTIKFQFSEFSEYHQVHI